MLFFSTLTEESNVAFDHKFQIVFTAHSRRFFSVRVPGIWLKMDGETKLRTRKYFVIKQMKLIDWKIHKTLVLFVRAFTFRFDEEIRDQMNSKEVFRLDGIGKMWI